MKQIFTYIHNKHEMAQVSVSFFSVVKPSSSPIHASVIEIILYT